MSYNFLIFFSEYQKCKIFFLKLRNSKKCQWRVLVAHEDCEISKHLDATCAPVNSEVRAIDFCFPVNNFLNSLKI